MLKTAQVVIVDEIHAVLQSRRGAHLALSLDGSTRVRPQASARRPFRHPEAIEEVAVPHPQRMRHVDKGHKRRMDLAVECPARRWRR